MKKIIFALLVLSIALIGIGLVSASSDVDNVNVDFDNGNFEVSTSNGLANHRVIPDNPYDPANAPKVLPDGSIPYTPFGPIDPSPSTDIIA